MKRGTNKLQLLNITINTDGSVTDKHGKTIKILPLEQRIERDKLKGKEWK